MDNKIDLKAKADISLMDDETPTPYQDAASVYVSDSFRRMVLGESVTKLFKNILGNPFGRIVSFSNGLYSKATATYRLEDYTNLSNNMMVTLLNLSSSFTPTPQLKYVPIIASDGSGLDNSVVTGYSLGELQSDLTKAGVLKEITSPSEMLSLSLLDNTYVWASEKGNGSINYVGILHNLINNPYSSNMAFKCISNYNVYTTGSQNRFGYILPDTKDTKGNVLTGPSQILTFETNGQSKWYYDVLTGEKRAVQPDEFAYNWTNVDMVNTSQIYTSQVVYGDYIYYVSGLTMYKIEIATGNTINNVVLRSSVEAITRPIGVWFDGTNIIASCYTTSTTEGRGVIVTVNPNTLSITRVNNSDYTGWGNLPSSWVKREINMQKVSDTYYIVSNASDTIICSDIMNVCGSIIGLMPSTGFNSFIVDNAVYQVYEEKNAVPIGLNINNTLTNVLYNGVYISDSCYSNYWNLGSMTPVITKQTGQELTLDMGFSLGYQSV